MDESRRIDWLKVLRYRLLATTEGPWWREDATSRTPTVWFAAGGDVAAKMRVALVNLPQDADFIADARNAMPALLDLAEAMRDALGGECNYDHHGYCQEHVWLQTEPVCPHKRASEALAVLQEAMDRAREQ